MHFTSSDIQNWEQKYRIRFINSISGYRAAHLIGTKNSSDHTNVAIFNSIVHIGASPALIGFIMRPVTVERHTYSNILETGCYTINHVHKSFLRNAHFTSASFAQHDSEFDKCKLTPEYAADFHAPFVAESKIKFGLKLKEDILIQSNDTRLIVGEIQHILIDDEIVEADGQLDLEIAHDVCVTGLNQYSSVSKFKKLPAAYIENLPDFNVKERADNVVFDTETQSYHAHLLPYGTNIGAPKISETGVLAWKNAGISNFNHVFGNKIEALKKNYTELIDEYRLNEMVYQAKISFEPIVGQVYHLYLDQNKGERFLSLIPPQSWKMDHLGSFKLNHDKVWQRVEDNMSRPSGNSVSEFQNRR
jgi:flavin reductase (DIM6/NTAB) family NADH-FMN oxidoreductase RutF